jgi:predicted MPP superfamily phosphohydrolase
LTASGLSHWLFARWLFRAFPKLRATQRRRKRVLAGIAFMAVLPFVMRLMTRFSWNSIVIDVLAFSLIELMMVIFGLVPLYVFYTLREVLFGKRVKRSRNANAKKVDHDHDHDHEREKVAATAESSPTTLLSRREVVERVVGLASYGTMGALLGWGLVRGRHAFESRELVVKIKGLPRSLDGYVIAQVSDIHTGGFVGERELREGFDLVRAIKPDLLVCTGDIVDFEAGWTPLFARLFSNLPSRDGRFAILGNHDYYAETDVVKQALADAKIDLLVNDGRMIRPQDGGGFSLLGVDDLWATRAHGAGPDLELALSKVKLDAPRILLAHQPKYFDVAAPHVALQLSGHTHGGQINPGFRPADIVMKYVAGRYDRGDATLYVNRGFGVAGPPSRVGAPPEVTKVVLVAG